jgi:NIPSNAP
LAARPEGRAYGFQQKETQMTMKQWPMVLAVLGAFAAGFVVHELMAPAIAAHAAANRVFEIRTYTAPPGKLDALKARFRDHTIKSFNKHDMTSIAYFTPQDSPLSANTIVYILAHPSREEAKKNWAAFSADPEWVKAKTESEKDGKIVDHADSMFVDPTDFSPIK